MPAQEKLEKGPYLHHYKYKYVMQSGKMSLESQKYNF